MPKFTEIQVEAIRQIIRDELQEFLASDRYIFNRDVEVLDGRNIQLAKGTGTKFGTATNQKLAFYGASPVVPPEGAGASGHAVVGGTNVDSDDAFTGAVGTEQYTIGDIVRALKLLGLIKS